MLNSKNYGVPQNRERIYVGAFRNDIDSSSFVFPDTTDDTKRIKDILEAAPISPKYYLSDVYVETLRQHRARHEAAGNGFGYEIRELDGIAGTIVCGGMGRERNLIVDHRPHSMIPTTHIKGEIKPGMLADFVVLGDNPFAVLPSAIKDIPVCTTYLGGKKVYSA